MAFEIVESLSLPGDAKKPNEDAFGADAPGAVVFDGATMVSDNLMPGPSDAAWIAAFGARRVMSHLKSGDGLRAALRHALADTERSFEGLRRRAPSDPHQLPLASMMLAVPAEGGFEAAWFGDCAALVERPGEAVEVIGTAPEKRAGEAAAAERFANETGLPAVEALRRAEFLPLFRAGRDKVNTPSGEWLFSPVAAASEHASRARIGAPAGSHVLLCTDGFLALVTNYRALGVDGLMQAAREGGLKGLGERLREIEDGDPEGRGFPRFKKSDDATAVLLRLT